MGCWDLAHILEVEPAAHRPILAVPKGMALYLYGSAVALFLAPLVFLYLDDTKIFDVLPQLGGEPVGYLGSCGYRNIEVVSLTVNGENRVYLDANDLYNDHLGTLLVNFNGVTNDTGTLQCKDLMLYVEEVEGRQLPNNADKYCSGRRGAVHAWPA